MGEDRWRVWRSDMPGGEEEAQRYPMRPQWTNRTLYDAQDAAEWWAECWDTDSAEYSIVGQRDEPVVTVEDLRDGGTTHWQVEGEAAPQYSARPWEKEDAA